MDSPPLLTARLATIIQRWIGPLTGGNVREAIKAIASGRVACYDTETHVAVQKMTEEQAREKFEAGFSPSTSVLRKDSYGCYIEKSAVFQWNGYRMALRDAGIIKP